jgi:hypothetical protein
MDGHNYLTWEIDVKISLTPYGMYEAIVSPTERTVQFLEPYKYNVLYIIRNRIHQI